MLPMSPVAQLTCNCSHLMRVNGPAGARGGACDTGGVDAEGPESRQPRGPFGDPRAAGRQFRHHASCSVVSVGVAIGRRRTPRGRDVDPVWMTGRGAQVPGLWPSSHGADRPPGARGGHLPGLDGSFRRMEHRTREVIEIPVSAVQVTEHVVTARHCPVCRTRRIPKVELGGVATAAINPLVALAVVPADGARPGADRVR